MRQLNVKRPDCTTSANGQRQLSLLGDPFFIRSIPLHFSRLPHLHLSFCKRPDLVCDRHEFRRVIQQQRGIAASDQPAETRCDRVQHPS